MAIPKQKEVMKLVCDLMADGKKRTRRQTKSEMCELLTLSEDDKKHLTNSGTPVYSSRVNWSISWLCAADYIRRIDRGTYVITSKGKAISQENLSVDDFMRRINHDRQTGFSDPGDSAIIEESHEDDERSPIEILDDTYLKMKKELSQEIMKAIMNIPGRDGDTFFEKIVTDLLVHMGYGEGKVTSASNDGGIDGIIKTDPLGFNPILIQAKRYSPDNKINRSQIQAFAGALGAVTRGAFITTSKFQSTAVEWAKMYPHADIVLIDGQKLVDLMIEYDLGVSIEKEIKIKKLDTDYFEA